MSFRIGAASAAGLALMAGYAVFAQRSGAGGLILIAGAQLTAARGAHDASGDLGDHPLNFRSADYDPVKVRRLVAAAMPASIATDSEKGQGVYAYVAGGGWPGVLLQRGPDSKWREIADAPPLFSSAGNLAGAFATLEGSHSPSLLLCGVDGLSLYRRDGRHGFSDVTRKAGLRSAPGVIYSSAAFGDLDGDGLPDLLVASYTDLRRPPPKPGFTFPNDFPGTASHLYRNNGGGTFTDVTESTPLATNLGRARKAILADLNGDGRLDILLLRDDKPPALYLNRGGWHFDDATWDAGDDLSAYAFFEGAVSDFNGDGKLDLALWATHIFRVLINQGKASFELAAKAHLPDPSISLFGYRGTVVDLDGNGFDDVITVDRDRRLRVFANQSGVFQETPVELQDAFQASYLAAVRLGGTTGLLAVRPDGSVVQVTPVDGAKANLPVTPETAIQHSVTRTAR